MDATPATRTFTVDTTAPGHDDHGGPTGYQPDVGVVHVHGDERQLDVRVQPGPAGGRRHVRGVHVAAGVHHGREGAYTFSVRAIDGAGNTRHGGDASFTVEAVATPTPTATRTAPDGHADRDADADAHLDQLTRPPSIGTVG